MKYKKIDIDEKFLGKGFFTYDWQETESRIDWYVRSKHKEVRCPVCNAVTSSVHSTYKRRIQGVPMKGKHTIIHLVANKYDCTNETCSNKVIVEPLEFASWKQRRTIDLDCLILAVSCFISDEGTSKILKTIGVEISNDSIYRLRKKLEFVDDPDIEKVGIDDVAIRKGQSYATAIYDMDDHHLIALLEGRDKETLKDWLLNHNKIRLVARDRASAYAAAINEVLPECTQIADRFHLLQNLIDHMKDIFKDELPSKIFIENGEILESEPAKKAVPVTVDENLLNSLNYDVSDPVDENGNVIEFDDRNVYSNGTHKSKQAENRKKNRK